MDSAGGRRNSVGSGGSGTESRQQPGYACEECRKKKLRCDRQRPQCGPCNRAGATCRVIDRRMPRAPRRPGMEALYKRMNELERHLSSMQQTPPSTAADTIQVVDEDLEVIDWDISDEAQHLPSLSPSASTTRESQQSLPPGANFAFLTPSTPSPTTFLPSPQATLSDDAQLSDLIKSDLTHLYFDRVHPVIPMLNQNRFAQLARNPNVNASRQCLQYAMWTLAITFSTQFGSLQETMYGKARATLEALDVMETDISACPAEQVQAWLLLTYYEFTKCSYRRAWLSAGRAFRFVHLARLQNLDNPRTQTAQETEMDPIEKEEKRRTFWVAYCLDRFISVSNAAPITLMEDTVCTRLPCLDHDFNNGLATNLGPFLSQVMTATDGALYSPLAELCILVTICGRALAHKQVTDVEALYGNSPMEFALRHDWLDALLSSRVAGLDTHYPDPAGSDPMVLFTHLISRTAVIYLCHIMEPLASDAAAATLVLRQQDRGIAAAQEVSKLAAELEHRGYFRTHPWAALPVYLSAAKLRSHIEKRRSQLGLGVARELEESLQASLDALRKLGAVNNLAVVYLQMVEANKSSDICFRME